MMFFKSTLTLSALLVLASALTLERQGKSCPRYSCEHAITHAITAPAHQEMQLIETKMQPGGIKGT
jgi:glycerol dehydrogenase-like iron-containing ADH family enzyme